LSRRPWPLLDFAKTVLAKLVEAQVEFIVVGGVSAVLQGVPITTVDLDICYRRTPENIGRLASVVAAFKARLRGFPPDLPFTLDARAIQLGSNFTLEIGDESFDLLGVMSGIGGYEDVINQAEDLVVGPLRLKVLSLAQLIATKEAAGRPKDLAVLPIIKATLAVKQELGGGN
jgi:hypothetical protein